MYPEANGGSWEYGEGGYPRVGGALDNVLDGFEDGTLDGYGGATGDFEVQTDNVLKGRHSLQSFDSYSNIGDDGGEYPTPRGSNPIEYRAHVYCENPGEAGFFTNVQNESAPYRNCYGVVVDTPDNEVRFFKRENGNIDYIERNSMGVWPNRTYMLFITLTSDGVNAGIRDSSGSELYRTDSYFEPTHQGGGIGWRSGEGGTKYFDHAARHPGSMGDLQGFVIDDFEDGDWNEYYSGSSSGSQDVRPAAAYEGDYGLRQDGFTSMMSTPGDGLENYLEVGKEYEFYFQFKNGGSPQYYIYLCPQNRTSTENTYELEFIYGDNVMRIQKDDNGSESTLPGHGTGEENFAYTNDIPWNTDIWYKAEVRLYSGGIRSRVYNVSNGNYLGYVRSEDGEFINDVNGLGFFCSGSGRWFVDEIKEIT